jgi:DNA-binding SARP family transcriptional activator
MQGGGDLMRFGVLGPLWVTDAGRDVAVTAGRDRIVLAMLLTHAGRIVAVEQLVDAVWEGAPPATARGQLQTCVSRLRRLLPAATILTDPAGYEIRVADTDLDAAVFTRQVARARELTADQPDTARALFREALARWRGPALSGLDTRAVRQSAAVLDEQHALAIEDWADLELAGGHDGDLVAELTGLVERFPLRERLRAQLMLSLYRIGRQADALAEYRRADKLLRSELGIEPGPALRDLHRRILAGAVDPAPAPEPSSAPVRCLPRTVGDFTGREDSVRRLLAAAERGAGDGPTLLVIDGMAGSGKTTLALHVAGLLGAAYPDAQLFLDLQGHSEQEPLEPGAALLALLHQLGVPAERIPVSLPERLTLWRTELSRRRALVVFDNAASSAQLRGLLPTSAGGLALITSRRRLAGLDGVHPESLPVLPEADGVALLARIVGSRVDDESAAALEVVRRCGGLPLAIRLAGARLAHRRGWRVADLVRRLGESALPELAAEDRTVASTFALSYQQLRPAEQRLFRLLGLQAGERFGPHSVAALADLPLDDVRAVLDVLVDVHLAEEPEPNVFRLHDLIRQYAAALAAELPAADRRAAVVRLLDFHLHAFTASNEQSHRAAVVRDLRLAPPARPDLVPAAHAAEAHLERERPQLAALVDAGSAIGRADYAWSLPRAAWRYLYRRGYIAELGALLRRGLDVARQAGELSAVATAANYLASVSHRLGEHEQARMLLETTVRLRRQLGDDAGLSGALANLGVIHEAAGRFAQSVALSRQALAECRRFDDYSAIARCHRAAATGLCQLGDVEAGLRHARLGLLAALESRESVYLAVALTDIAAARLRAGRPAVGPARRLLAAALRFNLADGLPMSQARTLNELALACRLEGRLDAAAELLRQAIPLVHRVRADRYESLYQSNLGEVLLALGDPAGAADCYARAGELARSRYPYEQATALAGQARLALAQGDPDGARRGGEQALELFTRMGVPERHDVARWLAALETDPDPLRASGAQGRMGA